MKSFEGNIVSISDKNTVIVEITRKTPHPLYKKLIKSSKKYKADTNGAEFVLGQTVRIVETRPISKSKYFKVVESSSKKVEKKAAAKPIEKTETKKTEKPVAKKVPAKKTVRKAAK